MLRVLNLGKINLENILGIIGANMKRLHPLGANGMPSWKGQDGAVNLHQGLPGAQQEGGLSWPSPRTFWAVTLFSVVLSWGHVPLRVCPEP